MCRTPALLLPQLDLSRLDGRATDHLDFLADLREAAHDVGFFYLAGHGITARQCEEILAVARKCFDLPESAKFEVEMIHSPHFRGYTRAGRELTRGRPDWREQFDINRTQNSTVSSFCGPTPISRRSKPCSATNACGWWSRRFAHRRVCSPRGRSFTSSTKPFAATCRAASSPLS